jgi:hypothetical protein
MPLTSGSPAVTILSADGSGTATVSPTSVAHGATGKTLVVTYKSVSGGTHNGGITLKVPTGWSAPSTTATAPGYVTTSLGTLAVSSRTVIVSALTLGGSSTVKIVYGSKAGGGPGATAPATAVGSQAWTTAERSTSSGVFTALATSPAVTVG